MIKWAIRDDWDLEVDRLVANFLLSPNVLVKCFRSPFTDDTARTCSSTPYGHKGETLVAVAGLQAIVDSVDSIIESAVHVRLVVVSYCILEMRINLSPISMTALPELDRNAFFGIRLLR